MAAPSIDGFQPHTRFSGVSHDAPDSYKIIYTVELGHWLHLLFNNLAVAVRLRLRKHILPIGWRVGHD